MTNNKDINLNEIIVQKNYLVEFNNFLGSIKENQCCVIIKLHF